MHANRGTIEAVIVDVDGTLVDVEGIRHLVTGENRNFDAFHRASIDCPPLSHVLDRVKAHESQGRQVVVVSGRRSTFLRLTEFWLALWNCPSNLLLMRDPSDNRPDKEVKREFFQKLPKNLKIIEAIDDRDELLELWKELGIPSVLDARKPDAFKVLLKASEQASMKGM